ncbi:hypothetical protein ASD88_10250 [Pelomonas sp. Root662]|nr:hypothetical protein ASC81_10250 [Pelomonas sp. Root405]KRA72154.1 hypothetical protein ASD88_10250 [Pelomonas sp. Root662]
MVLVDFWTYSCINCQRTLPYLRAWAQKYGPQGLVVIGVHAPEFGFERDVRRVREAAMAGRLNYPIVLDNDFSIWRAFENRAWPAFYFVDAQGRVRHQQIGEGNYEGAERVIRELLMESGRTLEPGTAEAVPAGVGLPSDSSNVRSPETYLGYARGEGSRVQPDRIKRYPGGEPRLNQWLLSGDWTVRSEYAEISGDAGSITLRFHARDLHLVLAPAVQGAPHPFVVTVDGQPPGPDAGLDVDASGRGMVTRERLYQLVRQRSSIRERRFDIRFAASGVRAYAFTFG